MFSVKELYVKAKTTKVKAKQHQGQVNRNDNYIRTNLELAENNKFKPKPKKGYYLNQNDSSFDMCRAMRSTSKC